MEWINFDKEPPSTAQDVLVLKIYLDAEYGEHGYLPDKFFWTKPVIQIDCYYSDKYWHNGGMATHWMPLPNPPN